MRVLRASNEGDRAEWLRLWENWSLREIFAHPAYAELFARPGDSVVCLFGEAGEDSYVLYPLIIRPLAREEWAGSQECAWDATSPYGYGGPFMVGGRADVPDFWRDCEQWTREHNVVTSFARLSLFPGQLAPIPHEPAYIAPNVVRDLQLTESELWRDYAQKVRKNVNAATRAGLTVEVDPAGDELDTFLHVYYSTMERRGASSGYFFPRNFFESLRRNLAGQAAFFHVREAGRVVASELVLLSAENIYSFLGGSLPEAFANRPGDLLKHEITLWGMREGKRTFVLGGGFRPGDGIFKYKLGFAPDGERGFHALRWVHDAAEYRRLEERRRTFELERGQDWSPDAAFFPSYRG